MVRRVCQKEDVDCLGNCAKQVERPLERLVGYVVGYRSGGAQAMDIGKAQHFL